MTTKIVIFRSGISGGTATLSIRIGNWLNKNGYDVIYICNKINDYNNFKSMKEKGIEVFVWRQENISSKLKKRYSDSKFIFLTYSLNEFIFIETLKKDFHILKSLLYVVSERGLVKGYKNKLLFRKIAQLFYGDIIKQLIKDNNVIFVDDLTFQKTCQYYGINFKGISNIIFNLPIELREYDKNSIEEKIMSETFNILTISRAELPFKGYMLGLISDFSELCNSHNDITLTIITFGKDEHVIKEKIDSLPSRVKNKITLIGQTPYEELENYFKRSHLFLGMGTTVLDSVNHCVPVLVVQPNTDSNNTSGFFHEHSNRLVAKKEESIDAKLYIKKIINMSSIEYKKLCSKEYDAVDKKYSMKRFIDRLLEIKSGNQKRYVSNVQFIFNKFITRINDILKLEFKNL